MRRTQPREGEKGQVLVVFVLALVAIIGVTGLVLDGGSAFAQRRQQQNVADLAAVAAVTAFINTSGSQSDKDAAARARALDVAADNGYPNAAADTSVTITGTPNPLNGSQKYAVTVERPHRNSFSSLLGQPWWDVSASATAIVGKPNGAIGAMPLIFNQKVFQPPHNPGRLEEYSLPGTGPEDVPQDATSFNWTVYCTAQGNDGETNSGQQAECVGNSDTVKDLIRQMGKETTVDVDDDIGPLNAGVHATLFADMRRWIDYEFPVGIVNDDGDLVGWAIFHITDTQGASRKVIMGYFVTGIQHEGMTITDGRSGTDFGNYVIKLIK